MVAEIATVAGATKYPCNRLAFDGAGAVSA